MKIRQSIFASISACFSLLVATSAQAGRDGAYSSLEAELQSVCEAGTFAGVVMVAQEGRPIFTHACGLADPANGVPHAIDTRFKIFSISKMVTALTVMSLTETGELSVDAPLSDYLPNIPLAWRTVTIRQLLNHTSGIPDLFERVLELYFDDHPTSMERLLNALDDDAAAMASAPGARFQYSNFGYELVAHAASRATGQSFRDLIRARVFDPAGMSSADIEPEHVLNKHPVFLFDPSVAVGFNGEPGHLVTAGSLSFTQLGAGAVRAAAPDFLALDRALTDGRIVRPETLAAMTERLVRNVEGEARTMDDEGVGLGFWVQPTVAGPAVGHTGGTNGYISSFQRFPEHNAMVIIMSSRGFTRTRSLLHAAAAAVAASPGADRQ